MMVPPAASPVTELRLAKIMALLDSDQAGEALAAARALRRVLDPTGHAKPPSASADPAYELRACLTYAVEAIDELTQEIKALRRDNARLRAQSFRHPAAPRAHADRSTATESVAPADPSYPMG